MEGKGGGPLRGYFCKEIYMYTHHLLSQVALVLSGAYLGL